VALPERQEAGTVNMFTLTVCWIFFASGSAAPFPQAFVPHMQSHIDISYAVRLLLLVPAFYLLYPGAAFRFGFTCHFVLATTFFCSCK